LSSFGVILIFSFVRCLQLLLFWHTTPFIQTGQPLATQQPSLQKTQAAAHQPLSFCVDGGSVFFVININHFGMDG